MKGKDNLGDISMDKDNIKMNGEEIVLDVDWFKVAQGMAQR